MRNVFLGSIALIVFSIAIIIFQISCKKTADAQTTNYTLPAATTSTLGGVIVGSGLNVTSNGTLSVTSTGGLTQLNKIIFAKMVTIGGAPEIWTMNYDGSNKTKINIAMPAGQEVLFEKPKLSPDGAKIIFMGRTTASSNNDDDIYVCNIDGSNVTKIYDMPVGPGHTIIGGAY